MATTVLESPGPKLKPGISAGSATWSSTVPSRPSNTTTARNIARLSGNQASPRTRSHRNLGISTLKSGKPSRTTPNADSKSENWSKHWSMPTRLYTMIQPKITSPPFSTTTPTSPSKASTPTSWTPPSRIPSRLKPTPRGFRLGSCCSTMGRSQRTQPRRPLESSSSGAREPWSLALGFLESFFLGFRVLRWI